MLNDALEKIRIIASLLDDDDPDKLEMMDVEGDYSKLMEWALQKRNDYAVLSDAAKALKDTYAAREKSFDSKANKMRDIVLELLISAGETKYQGAAGTASLKNVAAIAVVVDENLIPDDYFETKKVLNKSLINKAFKDGYEIPGVVAGNGGMTVQIRTK